MSNVLSINVGDKIYGPEHDGYRYTSYVCGFAENTNGEVFILTPKSFITQVSANDIFLRSGTSDFLSIGKTNFSPSQLHEKSAVSLLGYFMLNSDTKVSSRFDPAMDLDEAIAGATVKFDGVPDDAAEHFYVSNPNCWARLDAGEIFDDLIRIRAHEDTGRGAFTQDNSLIGRLCRSEDGILGVVIAVASEKAIIYVLPFSNLLENFNRKEFRIAEARSLAKHNYIIAKKRTHAHSLIDIGELMNKFADGETHVPNAVANLERWISENSVIRGKKSIPKIWSPIINESIFIDYEADTLVKEQEGNNLILVFTYLERAYSWE